MDDRRFDAFTRALARGGSRRSVLKGLLGLAGVAIAGEVVATDRVSAARRPTPTPKPVSCPGQQVRQGSQCVCPSGTKCGPACCHPEGTGAGYSECCDNECCNGHCYGEELCCQWPRLFCSATNECCQDGATCCGALGCVDLADGQCCSDAACPMNSTCNLDRFECVCDSGYIDCGDGCIAGSCCNAADCTQGVCYQHACCSPSTCASLPNRCGEQLSDGCGGTISCPCSTGVCFEGQCCTPKTCDDYSGQCGTSLTDGCGGTVSCGCSGSEICSSGQCIANPALCGPNDDPFCGDGTCALGVDGNYYNITVTTTETGDNCQYCTTNDDCVQLSSGNYPYCLQVKSWTDNTGQIHCELCPPGGGGLCGK